MKKTSTPTTVPATAGKNPTTQLLAQAYLEWKTSSGCRHRFNHFGQTLDLALREMLPDDSFGGLLLQREGDIRQDAAIDLLNKFLAGSTALKAAVAAKDLKMIGNAIEKCLRICLWNCQQRLKSAEAEHKAGKIDRAPLDGSSTKHELDNKMRKSIAHLLKSPTALKKLSADELYLLHRLIIDEVPRKELAQEIGKSPSWISSCLKMLGSKLKKSNELSRILEADM
jgi:hypothetical protein